ncbi:MAG TPA: FtsH protease activity modulator HflK [Candidatus Hydrogenedentes bacterium]|nr:FtsH protease activity modulator HflK [Candidatus Hydrogenedentota bacterium]HPG67355.1 FtsH protease activity modulator HflK [Candidatus Hydrogenedentota bacterium]
MSAGADDKIGRRPVLAKAVRAVSGVSLLAAIIVYGLSGIYVVQPEEQALILRFGELLPVPALPGTHYRLPYPIDRVFYFKPNEVKSVAIEGGGIGSEAEVEGEIIEDEAEGELVEAAAARGAEFLTGDENIIHVALNVQYRISDPARYLFLCADAPRLVRDAAEMALASTVAHTSVDDLLTSGKLVVLDRTRDLVQQKLDAFEAGVAVIGVNFTSVTPPAEVNDAFKDVASALEDRDRVVSEALGDQSETVYRARGSAQQKISEAQAYRESKINRASGEADRFLAVLAEYRQSGEPKVSLTRLRLEALEEVLSRGEKYLIAP